MSNLNFSRYLEAEKEAKLIAYLTKDLKNDLDKFEEIYGYRGNQFLMY